MEEQSLAQILLSLLQVAFTATTNDDGHLIVKFLLSRVTFRFLITQEQPDIPVISTMFTRDIILSYAGNGPRIVALIKVMQAFDLKREVHRTILKPCRQKRGLPNHGTFIGLASIHQNPNIKPKQSMEATLQRGESCEVWSTD